MKEEHLNNIIVEMEENLKRIRCNKSLSIKQKVEQLNIEGKLMLAEANYYAQVFDLK